MSQTYTYSISVDFPNNAVAPDVLTDQINDSSISSGVLEGITLRTPDTANCYIVFDVALSAPDVTTLDGIVAVHDGVPYLDYPPGEPGWNLRVEDRNLTVPPGSPTTGLFYIVAAGATGAWAGHEDAIASWNGTTWQYQLPSVGFAVWVIDEGIVVVYENDTTKWQPYGTGGGSATFGSNLHLAESTAVSTSTSASPQDKITLVTATLEAGTYRLEVSYGWNHDSTQNNFISLVTQDAVQVGQLHEAEPAEAGGTFESTGSVQRYVNTRVFHLSLSAQSYTFKLQYHSEFSGVASSVWDAYMSLWRMS